MSGLLNSTGAVSGIIGTTSAPAVDLAGHVLQIQSSAKLDAFTTTSVAFVDITGTDQNGSGSIWCVKITPSATSSKILVNCSIIWSFGTQGNTASYARILRDSTHIGVNSSVGSSASGAYCQGGETFHYYYNRRESHTFLDSPSSTSELTYKFQMGQYYNGDAYTPTDSTLSMNTNSYGANGADNIQVMKSISTITATEVKG